MSNCEIVDRAKFLAKGKGLDSHLVSCPISNICDGRNCMFDGVNTGEDQITQKEVPLKPTEKFFQRAEKTIAMRKNGHEQIVYSASIESDCSDDLKNPYYTDHYKLVGC